MLISSLDPFATKKGSIAHVKMIIKCPLIIAEFIILKLFHLLTHQDLKPGGGEVSSAAALKEGGAAATQKKGPISFILLAPPHREMAFFAQFWGVTLHLFWLLPPPGSSLLLKDGKILNRI